MTPRQIELARHALGLPNDRHRSYRNSYVVEKGTSRSKEWKAMVAAGIAESREGLNSSMAVFWLTKEGATAALKPGESLDAEDFP
jgi:hypothetical protein